MRTDTQKLNREPVIVVIAGNEYKNHPQSYKHSRAWKGKAKPTVEQFGSLFKTNFNDTASAFDALREFLFETFDQMIDLCFEYDPSLPKDEIVEAATEDELFEFILKTMEVAFPLVKRLGMTPANLAKAQSMTQA